MVFALAILFPEFCFSSIAHVTQPASRHEHYFALATVSTMTNHDYD